MTGPASRATARHLTCAALSALCLVGAALYVVDVVVALLSRRYLDAALSSLVLAFLVSGAWAWHQLDPVVHSRRST